MNIGDVTIYQRAFGYLDQKSGQSLNANLEYLESSKFKNNQRHSFSYCYLNCRNVLNVDEPAQLITVETSLRMTWVDPRLTVRIPPTSPTNYVLFRSDATRYIWFPDVYIDGIHTLRKPAYKVTPAYLRIYNNSKIKYSARVNYDVACPMHFEEYPMDTQRCNISFESWGHTSRYIVLTWLREKRIFSDSIALAQFDLGVHFVEEPLSNFSILGEVFSVIAKHSLRIFVLIWGHD